MQDAQIAKPDFVQEPQPALPLRSDTILGVCEALGQDFGVNANYLRVALASMVLWNGFVAAGIYLSLGLAVALSRWIYPRPAEASQATSQHPIAVADNQTEGELLAA